MSQTPPPSNDAFNDSLSFVKKLWGQMGVPGMTPTSGSSFGMPMPTTSLEDMDKRIGELKTVESWLNVNMTMLHNTIQALEIQRATVAALHSLSATMAQPMPANVPASSPTSSPAPETSTEDAKPTTDMTPIINQSAMWWNGVQEQFKNALEAALANNAQASKETKPQESAAKPAKAPRKPRKVD